MISPHCGRVASCKLKQFALLWDYYYIPPLTLLMKTGPLYDNAKTYTLVYILRFFPPLHIPITKHSLVVGATLSCKTKMSSQVRAVRRGLKLK